MNLLYMVFIYPLEYLMQLILEFSYSITDNYGLSIIVLSVVINIILLPLYYMAEKWKAKDKKLQDSMKPEINNIKKHYKGPERHFYIQTIYRRFGFHPFSSIKASIGFLIQIPFFFAAFHLLSNYGPIYGVSFGIFENLGNPDGLIGSVNMLPILMTIVNLLSAYIYIELLNKSEKIQLFGLAFIFLVVLYNEPAGLLLYWTMNNVFSLFKNLIEKKFKMGPLFKEKFKKRDKSIIRENIKKIYLKTKTPIWFSLLVVFIGIDRIYNFNLNKENFFYGFEAIAILLYLNFMVITSYISNVDKKNMAFKILIFLFLLVFIVFSIDFFTQAFKFTSSVKLINNMMILLVSLFLLLIFTKIIGKLKFLNTYKPTYKLFILIYTSLILLLVIVNPIMLYNSDEFLISSSAFLMKLITVFVMTNILIWIIYYISSQALKISIIFIGAYLLLTSLIYSFIVVKDYGLIDQFIFNDPSKLIVSQDMMFYEIIALIVFAVLSFFILIKYKNIFEKALFGISIMLLMYVYYIFQLY